jgi:ATP phosphoribosyltransferase
MQAHLKAESFYSVVANMRGSSPEEVAGKILSNSALKGLQVQLQ